MSTMGFQDLINPRSTSTIWTTGYQDYLNNSDYGLLDYLDKNLDYLNSLDYLDIWIT
jgi:hypothetical protein